jgi:hypothetical protein
MALNDNVNLILGGAQTAAKGLADHGARKEAAAQQPQNQAASKYQKYITALASGRFSPKEMAYMAQNGLDPDMGEMKDMKAGGGLGGPPEPQTQADVTTGLAATRSMALETPEEKLERTRVAPTARSANVDKQIASREKIEGGKLEQRDEEEKGRNNRNAEDNERLATTAREANSKAVAIAQMLKADRDSHGKVTNERQKQDQLKDQIINLRNSVVRLRSSLMAGSDPKIDALATEMEAQLASREAEYRGIIHDGDNPKPKPKKEAASSGAAPQRKFSKGKWWVRGPNGEAVPE